MQNFSHMSIKKKICIYIYIYIYIYLYIYIYIHVTLNLIEIVTLRKVKERVSKESNHSSKKP